MNTSKILLLSLSFSFACSQAIVAMNESQTQTLQETKNFIQRTVARTRGQFAALQKAAHDNYGESFKAFNLNDHKTLIAAGAIGVVVTATGVYVLYRTGVLKKVKDSIASVGHMIKDHKKTALVLTGFAALAAANYYTGWITVKGIHDKLVELKDTISKNVIDPVSDALKSSELGKRIFTTAKSIEENASKATKDVVTKSE